MSAKTCLPRVRPHRRRARRTLGRELCASSRSYKEIAAGRTRLPRARGTVQHRRRPRLQHLHSTYQEDLLMNDPMLQLLFCRSPPISQAPWHRQRRRRYQGRPLLR